MELRQAAFKIRHKVYCSELGWEPISEDKMECDEYDDYSFHCLLEYKRTKTFTGCIRLIIPPVENPNLPLPFEKNCIESARKNILDSCTLQRGSFGEISRLAVLSEFRRRVDEENKPYVLKEVDPKAIYTENERRNFPNIAIGLYLAGIALSNMCNHQGTFVMMEPRLNSRLMRFGLPFLQVGDEMDYHGTRAMFYLSRENYCSQLSGEMNKFYQFIHSELRSQICLLPHTNPTDS